MKGLYTSKLIAYIIQILSTFVVLYAYFRNIPSEHSPLKQALGLETIVQIIQVAVYTLLIIQFNLANMASVRYFDWIITTPLMLLALMIYLNYETDLYENKKTEPFNTFIEKNINNIYIVLIANGFMLLLGLLGELGYISKLFATIGGFIGLLGVFWIIYRKYAVKSKKGKIIFIPFASVWSIYGIAYNFSEINKNLTYNILDTIAKNIFGLFLSYNVFEISNNY